MTPQVLKQRLHEGPVVFGTLVVSPSPRWAEAIDGAGLDFVFIDTEHIALDREQLSWMCHGYARLGLPPLVRIPSPDPYAATMVLDGGAAGVIAPYVETVEQVEALRGAVKMRPIKGRKLDRLLKGAAAEPDLASYLTEGAEQRLLIINIESIDAIEALDALLERMTSHAASAFPNVMITPTSWRPARPSSARPGLPVWGRVSTFGVIRPNRRSSLNWAPISLSTVPISCWSRSTLPLS
jgi:hypothetical protein